MGIDIATIERTRLKLGISKNELSRRAGLGKGYYSALTTGDMKSPTVDVLERIGSVLGLGLPEMVGGAPGPRSGAVQPQASPREVSAHGWLSMINDAARWGGGTPALEIRSGDLLAFGMLPGDIVIYDPRTPAEQGEIVVIQRADEQRALAHTEIRRYAPLPDSGARRRAGPSAGQRI